MRRHVGFVRNVMIGREGLHRVVLLDAVVAAGGVDPVSYISTGNVSFDLEPHGVDGFRDDLEERIEAVIGRHEPVFVRTLDELATLHRRNHFAEEPFDDVVERVVTFCPDSVEGRFDLPLILDKGRIAIFAAAGNELFSVNRLVAGRTRAPGGLIEKMLGAKVTTRAISTVERIVAKDGH